MTLDWNRMLARLTRIAKFDSTVWAEIEHDESANIEAAVVVVAAFLLSALGSGLGVGGIGGFFSTLLGGVLLNWLLWSFVTMFVGTKLFGGEATFWEMARCLGYATAPSALGILAIIPCVGLLVGIAAWILSLVIGFFATREALDLPTDKTIITVIIGWVVVLVISMVVAGIFGMTASLF
jgi:hypothetical protein